MQCACPILSPVACPSLQYSSTLSHKRHDFRKKKMLLKTKCVFWFFLQLLSETFLILRRSERDMIRYVYWSYCKEPIILTRFEWNLNFLDNFRKKYSNIKFHENPSSGCRVIPCGRTDMMKLKVTFRNFANAPKNALQPGSKSVLIYSAEPRPWTKRQCCNTCCGKFVDEYPTVAALMGQQFPSSYSVTNCCLYGREPKCWFVFCVCKTIVDGCIRSYMRSWPRCRWHRTLQYFGVRRTWNLWG